MLRSNQRPILLGFPISSLYLVLSWPVVKLKLKLRACPWTRQPSHAISRPIAQQRRRFAIFVVGFLVWHVPVLSFVDLSDGPCVMLFGILEERLVVFKGSATRFRGIRLHDRISIQFLAST